MKARIFLCKSWIQPLHSKLPGIVRTILCKPYPCLALAQSQDYYAERESEVCARRSEDGANPYFVRDIINNMCIYCTIQEGGPGLRMRCHTL